MGWRIFKATDSGAPAATLNVAGQLAAILRACLIDGYGTGEDYKAPVGGWSEPFAEANNVAVFRADTGNRQFYQIQDSSAAGAPFRAYESMSDIDTGVGVWFQHYLGKYYNTSNMDWIVLANEKTVILFFVFQNGWAPQMFGEYESFFSGFGFNDIVCGCSIAQGREPYNFAMDTEQFSDAPIVGEGAYVHRLPDGSGLGAYCSAVSLTPRATGSDNYSYSFDATNLTEKKPVLWPLLLGGLFDTTSSSGTDYYNKSLFIGIVPLILGSDCAFVDLNTSINQTAEWTDVDSGETYLLLPFGVSGYTIYSRAPLVIPLGDVT